MSFNKMESTYVNSVYINPSIHNVDKNGYISVYAKKGINSKDLLLLEHTFTGSSLHCRRLICFNQYLYNELYPRSLPWIEGKTSAKDTIVDEKIQNNVFGGLIEGEFTIGCQISKFNHNCDPNAFSIISDKVVGKGMTTFYMSVYAIKPILAGEEINISYRKNAGHDPAVWNFNCMCNLTLEERSKKWDINNQLIEKLRTKKSLDIRNRLLVYEPSEESQNIFNNQFLLTMGVIKSTNELFTAVPQFKDEISKIYKSLKK